MPHQIWSGSISFGLVTIPIKLFPATEDKQFSFNQLCPKGHRIKYKRWCPVEEKENSYQDIQKGYQIHKDEYIVIERQDLEKIRIKSTKAIDIKEFVSITELDPILIEKSYYIAPDTKKGNDKAYSLLAKVLTDSKKIAIGKIVLRDKENVVALRPYQRGMVMHILKFLDELRPTDDIPEIKESASSAKNLEREEISLAKMLVDKFSSRELDLGEYSDSYAKELEKLIDAKAKGKPLVTKAEPEQKARPDLLEALKASMQIKKSK